MRIRMSGWQLGLCVGLVVGGAPRVWAAETSTDEPGAGVAMTALQEEADTALAGLIESAAMRVSLEFENANIKDVLKTFSQQTGLNVIASESVGDRTVTLYLEDVAVMDALDQILEAANLFYTRPTASQIYIVKSKPAEDLKLNTVTKVYKLKYARVSSSRLAKAVEAFGQITPFEARQLTQTAGQSGGTGGTPGAGSSLSLGGGAGGAGGGGATTEDVGIDKVIEELLTDQGKVVVDERTNSLIVSDLPENFPRIDATIHTLDMRTAQLLIEVELLETTLDKVKDLGVEWGTGSEGTQFTLTPAQRSTKFPFIFGSVGEESFKVPSSASGAFTTFDKSGQISVGSVNTSQAVMALQMLEKDTDTKILARPKVLTLDNESAVIRLTSQQAIGFQTTTGEESGLASVTPERTTTGVILVVTPQINEEGYVTMLVEPSVTKVVSATVTPPSNAGTVVDPKTRSARALVRIRQGETLVLGGLIDRSETEVLQKVPILGDIPVLGEAFKNRETNRSASELIVFVTPRILSEPATQVASAQVPEAPEPARPSGGPSRYELMEETLNRVLEKRSGNGS